MTARSRALDGAPASRDGSFWQSRGAIIELVAIAGALLILAISTLPNLANHPTPTDDEIWVMSASYKLATQGVFGSDMFAGFFNADSHYYFNLPGHHFAVALAFKLLGAGIVQARLVGIVYAVATLILSYVLARKVYGVPAGILTLGLLLFLRFNIGFDTGLPLQEQAVNMRYDLAPVPFMLAGLLILLGGTTIRRVVLAGAFFGLASLMQFYGAFVIPVAVAFIWLEAKPRPERLRLIAGMGAPVFLVVLPYLVFILSGLDDYRGQAGTLDDRTDFTSPGFYVDNLLHEPDRFLRPLAFKEVPRGADHETVEPQFLSLSETLTRRPSAKIGVLIGLPLALGFFGWHALRQNSRANRLLLLSLAGLVLQLTLLDSTKFFIYWMPVIPFICIGLAAASIRLLQPQRRDAIRLIGAGATALVLMGFFAEGSAARISGIRAAPDAKNYGRITDEIHRYVPEGSRVVGSTSLWWGLRDTEFRSYFLFFYLTRPDAGEHRATISQFLKDYDAEYLVLTELANEEMEKHLIPSDYQDLQTYLRDNATKVTRIEGSLVENAYDSIDIWKLN